MFPFPPKNLSNKTLNSIPITWVYKSGELTTLPNFCWSVSPRAKKKADLMTTRVKLRFHADDEGRLPTWTRAGLKRYRYSIGRTSRKIERNGVCTESGQKTWYKPRSRLCGKRRDPGGIMGSGTNVQLLKAWKSTEGM